MVKIKTYTIHKQGERGFAVGLPAVWIRDLGLNKGDVLNFYRTEDDLLVITNRELRGENNGN